MRGHVFDPGLKDMTEGLFPDERMGKYSETYFVFLFLVVLRWAPHIPEIMDRLDLAFHFLAKTVKHGE